MYASPGYDYIFYFTANIIFLRLQIGLKPKYTLVIGGFE